MHQSNSKVKYIKKLYGALEGSYKHLFSLFKLLASMSVWFHQHILFGYLPSSYNIVRQTVSSQTNFCDKLLVCVSLVLQWFWVNIPCWWISQEQMKSVIYNCKEELNGWVVSSMSPSRFTLFVFVGVIVQMRREVLHQNLKLYDTITTSLQHLHHGSKGQCLNKSRSDVFAAAASCWGGHIDVGLWSLDWQRWYLFIHLSIW